MSRALVADVTIDLAQVQIAVPVPSKIAFLLERVIFFSLLGLIPMVAIPYGTVEPWWQAAFESIVYLLAAMWIIEGFLSKTPWLNHWKLFLPLLGLVVFAWLQTLPLSGTRELGGIQGTFWHTISADPYNTRRFALKLMSLVLVGMMLLRYTSSRLRLRALISVILGTGVASALFGLLRQTVQTDPTGFILPYLPLDSGYGQFINRNHFAFLMELTLGLALGLMVGQLPSSFSGGDHRRMHWLFYAAIALPLWLALVLSNSRGGIFSMLCLVLLVASLRSSVHPVKRRRARIIRVGLAACFLAVLVIGSLWVGGDPLMNRLETVSDEVTVPAQESVRRLEVWRATWQLIEKNWLVGVGFGGYWAALPEYHQASGLLIPQEAHNDYLELLASGGVISLILAGCFVVAFVQCVWRRWQHSEIEQRTARLGALAGLCAIAVHSFFDFGLHITANALIATALAVIAVSDTEVA